MKPFVWITALVLSLPFLGGAVFTGLRCFGPSRTFSPIPESKIAVGWLFTGLMFLAMGVRGWKSHRRKIDMIDQRGKGRPS